MKAGRIAWSIVGLLSFCAAVRAGPVTWGFEGVVTLVDDRNNVLGGAVEVGSPLSGYYTFESTTSSDPVGSGAYRGAIQDGFGVVGNVAFRGPVGTPRDIYVFNDITSGQLVFDSYSADFVVQIAGISPILQVSLGDLAGDIFSSWALPVVPPPFEALDLQLTGFHLGLPTEDFAINGELTSIWLVPEPHTVLLFAIGLLSLAVRGRGDSIDLRVETQE